MNRTGKTFQFFLLFGFSESEYAYKLAKPIVPLLMERDYKPDGWLGALLGMQLYADLSSEDALETKMNDVLRMIKVKVADENAETAGKRCMFCGNLLFFNKITKTNLILSWTN